MKEGIRVEKIMPLKFDEDEDENEEDEIEVEHRTLISFFLKLCQ